MFDPNNPFRKADSLVDAVRAVLSGKPVEEKKVEETLELETQEEAMDPVNPKALKKKFKDRKDKDIDNDGDVDNSDEYLHKRRQAISKAMKEKVEDNPANTQHICAKNVVHENWGEGVCIPTMHADPDEEGNVSWYDVMFKHGLETRVSIDELKVTKAESHNHSKKNKKVEEDTVEITESRPGQVMSASELKSAYKELTGRNAPPGTSRQALQILVDKAKRQAGTMKKTSGDFANYLDRILARQSNEENDDEDDDMGGRGDTDSEKERKRKKDNKAMGKKDDIDLEPKTDDKKMVAEKEMTDAQMKRREEIVKGMKDKMGDFKKRYGDRAKDVMYATATKMALKEAMKPYVSSDSDGKHVMNAAGKIERTFKDMKSASNYLRKHYKRLASVSSMFGEETRLDEASGADGWKKVSDRLIKLAKEMQAELQKKVKPRAVKIGDRFTAGGESWKVIDVNSAGTQATLATGNRLLPALTVSSRR